MAATKLKIRIYGDLCLRKVSEPLKGIGPSERILIEAMIITMHAEKGVGLAAPQVGINKRIFVADVGDGPEVFINPKIIVKKSVSKASLEEGCLSIPGINVDVSRPAKITVEYYNINGELMSMECQDLLARVVQHENDHLDGKLIIDYLSPKKQKAIEGQLDDLKAGKKKPSKQTADD